MSQDHDASGLDLFDENASAVRGFPNAMLGYDKKAVDDYVRDLERQLSLVRHQMREVQRELTAANLRVDDTDFSKLGTHTAQLLKVAESQAAELMQKAQNRVQAMLEEARGEAERTRNEAAQTSEAARREGIESIKVLRTDLEGQTATELEAARTEAQGLRDAADAHRETVLADAEQRAAALVAQAQREGEAIRQAAEKDAAAVRAEVAQQREDEIAALHAEQASLSDRMTAATDEARQRSAELQDALARASHDLRGRQQAAYTEAEDIKAAAINDAAAIIAQARAEAEARLADTDTELTSRHEVLTRENRQLRQRKQALMTQLAQVSSMISDTASEFPDDEHTGPIDLGGLDVDLAAEPTVGYDPQVDEADSPTPGHDDEGRDGP